jgi:hypothetical protein
VTFSSQSASFARSGNFDYLFGRDKADAYHLRRNRGGGGKIQRLMLAQRWQTVMPFTPGSASA